MRTGVRALTAWLGIAAAAGVAVPARAEDTVTGTRSSELVERSHHLEIVVDRGHARLVVRRTLYNGGAEHDQALFSVSLPDAAVAVGLRTLGTRAGRPHWFAGELLEAAEAASRYRELTGIGDAEPKDPALLSWQELGELRLQVFPCAPQAQKTIEYTLLMPTHYEDGRHLLRLPRLGTQQLPATATVHAARVSDRLLLDGQPLVKGARIELDAPRTVELLPSAPPPVEGALALAETGHGTAVSRWRLDVAHRISEVPRHARVIIAIDASRSMTRQRHQAGAAAAAAYLSHFDAAEVEVIDFDRRPHRRHGRFVTPSAAISDLERRAVPLGNGSHVDAALEFADQLLTEHPGPGRIVLVTDTRVRSSLTIRDLEAGLSRSRAILHLGTIDPGEASLSRDDEHAWSRVARRTGGLFWSAVAPVGEDAAADAEDARRVFEEWARPLRIDRAELHVSGRETSDRPLDPGDDSGAGALAEGASITELVVGAPVPWVELTGELWSQAYREVWRPDADESRRWAALVFGEEAHRELDEAEMLALAFRGDAVSPVTSYLAIEPGVRPSTAGLDQDGLGLSGIGEGGGGRGEGIGLGSIGSLGSASDGWIPDEALAALVQAAWHHCGGEGTVEVTVETTWDEIVDVPVVKLAEPDAASRACLLEAIWGLTLEERFCRYESERFEMVLQSPPRLQ